MFRTYEVVTPEYDVCADLPWGGPIRNKADAYLIASAPELLAALERLMDLDDHCDYADEPHPEVCPGDPPEVDGPCHWCQARAAIAKAKGRG